MPPYEAFYPLLLSEKNAAFFATSYCSHSIFLMCFSFYQLAIFFPWPNEMLFTCSLYFSLFISLFFFNAYTHASIITVLLKYTSMCYQWMHICKSINPLSFFMLLASLCQAMLFHLEIPMFLILHNHSFSSIPCMLSFNIHSFVTSHIPLYTYLHP